MHAPGTENSKPAQQRNIVTDKIAYTRPNERAIPGLQLTVAAHDPLHGLFHIPVILSTQSRRSDACVLVELPGERAGGKVSDAAESRCNSL